MQKEFRSKARIAMMGAALFVWTLCPFFQAYAENKAFDPIRESKAYQQYKHRPVSDFSKLIYLIDRFGSTNVQVVYNGHYFQAPFAARVARWFLATNYKKETTKEWIMRWCSTTIPQGTPIYVKFADGKFRLAREVLTEEIELLDKIVKQNQADLSAGVQLTAPLAQLVAKSPAPPHLDSPPNR